LRTMIEKCWHSVHNYPIIRELKMITMI
jgi:hypothetical protein